MQTDSSSLFTVIGSRCVESSNLTRCVLSRLSPGGVLENKQFGRCLSLFNILLEILTGVCALPKGGGAGDG